MSAFPPSSALSGVERIIEIDLNKTEKEAFDKSVGAVAGLCEACINIALSPQVVDGLK